MEILVDMVRFFMVIGIIAVILTAVGTFIHRIWRFIHKKPVYKTSIVSNMINAWTVPGLCIIITIFIILFMSIGNFFSVVYWHCKDIPLAGYHVVYFPDNYVISSSVCDNMTYNKTGEKVTVMTMEKAK